MDISESFLTALESLRANKLRTVLTMLGVIIGVGAVISMIAIAQGARRQTMERIQLMGSNILVVMAGQMRRGSAFMGFGSVQSLTVKDAEAILKECPAVLRVSPETSRSFQVKYSNKNTMTSVVGVGPDYDEIRNLRMVEGRFLNEQEARAMGRVCILGHAVWENLFGDAPCVGKRIRIGSSSFLVIGRVAYKGVQDWRNPDDQIYVPISTAMKRLMGVNYIRSISVQARSAEALRSAQQQIEEVMRKQHKIPRNGEPDFRVFNQGELVETAEQTSTTFTFLLAGVALVSLIVGGIGIMNIMLVSVTERTREIGLRKAIGATRWHILMQFLIESLVMSVLGGLIGIGLGFATAYYIGNQAGWQIYIAPYAVFLAFSFAAFVGIFFGMYPAWRAAQLQPIEALRYE